MTASCHRGPSLRCRLHLARALGADMGGGLMASLREQHPVFAHKITQFMMLRDAAEVLAELEPPYHETAAAYLQEIADHLIRDAGIPEDWLQAMIAARPPVD